MPRIDTWALDEPDPHDPETNGHDPDWAHDHYICDLLED